MPTDSRDVDSTGPQVQGEGLLDALSQTAFLVMGELSRLGAENELSLTQLRVLGILRDRRLRMSELADYLGLEKSTMSGLVDRAEKRGLLERGRNPSDQRAVDVYLTERGVELAEVLYGRLGTSASGFTDRLSAYERDQLSALLWRMLGPQSL